MDNSGIGYIFRSWSCGLVVVLDNVGGNNSNGVSWILGNRRKFSYGRKGYNFKDSNDFERLELLGVNNGGNSNIDFEFGSDIDILDLLLLVLRRRLSFMLGGDILLVLIVVIIFGFG